MRPSAPSSCSCARNDASLTLPGLWWHRRREPHRAVRQPRPVPPARRQPLQGASLSTSVTARSGALTLDDHSQLHANLAHHLGSTTSFFTRWLPSCSAVFALSTLSDEERSVVSGWIGALFGEGISDDLMQCVACLFLFLSLLAHVPTRFAIAQCDQPTNAPPRRAYHPQAVAHGPPGTRRRPRQPSRRPVVLLAGAAQVHAAGRFAVARRGGRENAVGVRL